MPKKIIIDYNLDDLKDDIYDEMDLLKRIKKSRNYALTILFLAKKINDNQNILVKDLSDFLGKDRAYAYQILENLVSHNVLKKVVSTYKGNVYVPVYNSDNPIIYNYVEIAKEVLGLKK